MRLFDSHSHLQDERFGRDLAETIARAKAAGVERIAVLGYDRSSNAAALAMAERYEGISPAVGYHPHEAKDVTAAMVEELAEQASRPEVALVGEIGLDYHHELSPREPQQEVLARQLQLSLSLGKPVAVHSRGAEDELFNFLEPFAREWLAGGHEGRPGVLHCFGGTLEQAQRYVLAGFFISIAAVVTYPKSEETRRIAAELPLESLLIETDSPYLPPQGLRGKRNEPAYVRATAEAVAAARGVGVETVAEATFENACRLYRIPVPEAVGS